MPPTPPAPPGGPDDVAYDPVLDPDRLAALAATGLAEGGAAPSFGRSVRLVQRCLRVPTALVSLIDADRQVFAAQRGVPEPWRSLGETPLSHSFCQHVVRRGAPLVVEDARAHPLVRDNAAIDDLGVVAYLGVPLRAPGGEVLGALCAIDGSPRAWTDADRDALEALAEAAEDEIATRLRHRARTQALMGARARTEALFEALFDGISQLTGLLDADGAVLEANRTALAFAGVDRDWVVGRPLWDAFALPAAAEARHRDAVRRAAAGEAVRYEETLVDGRGVEHVLDVSLRPALGRPAPGRPALDRPGRPAAGGAGGLLLLEGRDVTEAVRLRHVQSAMLAGSAGTWEIDLVTGRVVTHGGTDALFGLDPADGPHAADDYYGRLLPEDAAEARRNLASVARDGGEYEVERRVARPDGTVRWVRSRGVVLRGPGGAPERVLGALADVTDERERAERAARTADDLQIALDAAQMGLWEAELGGGAVVHDGPGRALHGLPPRGRSAPYEAVLAVVHPEDQGRMAAAYAEASAAGLGARFDETYRVVRADGERWLRGVGEVRDGAAGPRLLGVVWDVTDERAAAADVRRSRRRLQLALLAANLGTFEYDTATGRQTADGRALRVLGLDDDVPPDAFLARVHPDDRPALRRYMGRAAAGTDGPIETEYRLVDPAGATRWVASSAWGRAGADGAVRVVGTVRDVTEEREAAAALRESEERKAVLLELAETWRETDDPAAIVAAAAESLGRHLGAHRVGAWEVRGDTLDFGVGPSWAAGPLGPLTGAVPAAALGEAVLDGLRAGRTVRVADAPAEAGSGRRAFAAMGVRSAVVAPVVRGGAGVAGLYAATAGPRPWTEAEATFVGEVADRAWDAVERARAQRALRESEARFRGTFENAAVGIAHVALDGTWLDVNDRLCEIVGYTHDEMLGRTFQDITYPDDLGADLDLFERLLAGEIDHYGLEKRYVHRDGRPVWIHLTVAPNWGAGGGVEYVISVVEDVTAKKAAEAALVALNEALEDRVAARTAELARSNAELDQFAYVASHDLKAPLRAIDSLAAWIEEDAGDRLPPESARHLALLRGRAERMEGLLDGLLAYSRAGREEAAPEPVDTGALARDVVALVAPPEGFDVRVLDPFPTVETARAPLALVLRNLVGNAIKHHDRPDGRVTVSASVEGGPVGPGGGPGGGAGWARFVVEDDGPGVAPAYRDRVFGMFQTLRPRDEVEGSGMGLAIVKKTVEARGGAVTVGPGDGVGARFEFTWPLRAAARPAP